MTFYGERLSTLYLLIMFVARFLSNATFLLLSLYLIKINGPIFGRAYLDAFDLLIKIN